MIITVPDYPNVPPNLKGLEIDYQEVEGKTFFLPKWPLGFTPTNEEILWLKQCLNIVMSQIYNQEMNCTIIWYCVPMNDQD